MSCSLVSGHVPSPPLTVVAVTGDPHTYLYSQWNKSTSDFLIHSQMPAALLCKDVFSCVRKVTLLLTNLSSSACTCIITWLHIFYFKWLSADDNRNASKCSNNTLVAHSKCINSPLVAHSEQRSVKLNFYFLMVFLVSCWSNLFRYLWTFLPTLILTIFINLFHFMYASWQTILTSGTFPGTKVETRTEKQIYGN